MSKTKNGFTLVELLAVIAVLSVILIIAVPQVMKVMDNSKKGVLASSAKLIANSAENIKLSNDTLGIEKDIECSDMSNYTREDYASCSIKFVDGKAKVTLVGQGKFEGMSICNGTKENAAVVDECLPTAVEKIESLATESNTEGLITDDFGNIRYAGASPKNYVKFNDEDWRIIGLFEVTTSSGKTEKLMKIVRNASIGDYSWDSSASSVNRGYGVNQWGEVKDENGNIVYTGADLMTELNTLYLNSGSGYCCNNKDQATCDAESGAVACNFTSTGINSTSGIKDTYREMIENVVWNTGAIEFASSIERSSAYSQEREDATGKICTSGTYCNDSVARTKTWTGKVGLIYPSDFGYASTNETDIRKSAIGTTNWLNSGNYWTLSPLATSAHASAAWYVDSGYVDYYGASDGYGVRPAIYLKSDVSITSGVGTEDSPYQISMN